MTQNEFLDYAFTIIKSQLQYDNHPYKINTSSTTEDTKCFWVYGQEFRLSIISDDTTHGQLPLSTKAKNKLDDLGTMLLSELQWGDDQIETDFDLDRSSITSSKIENDWKYSTPEYSIVLALVSSTEPVIEKERERF